MGINNASAAWAFCSDLSEDMCEELERFAKQEDLNPASSSGCTDHYLSVLSEVDPLSNRELYEKLTYWFPNLERSILEKDCILIDSGNQYLLEE